MPAANEQNFNDYKRAEAKALEPHVVFVDADNKVMGTGADPADTFGDETLSRGDLVAR